ncbi:ketoacyl-ACP synthase III family protein [Streptomyces sp. SPB074]|uniref:ketoacyl-ACP synthase III family protein n=1 Tax=Streptomyces sp. (strain SPB074) TaxID=465543 RepID=UPI00017F11ED|nr:ketoacyl-ACP synthase III family protein [Streptomyces sp. SPB074]EDY42529.1 3-oxoacyl-ACP synthase III [Streptomyces sp. SPB074]
MTEAAPAPDVLIAGCAAWLPPRVPAAEAVAAGRCDEALVASTGMVSVAVARDEPPPEMAARAARTALDRAGFDDVSLILHASFFYQGHDLWAPASYVQRVAVGNRCPAIEVGQVSNGGMAALGLAVDHLRGGAADGAEDRRVLVTTGDAFRPPGFDRWRSDPGTFYGDGGTALVLSSRRGFARVRSLATVSAPGLEAMHRGDDPFGHAPFAHRPVVDLDACKKDFLASRQVTRVIAASGAAQDAAVERALASAGVALGDVDRFVLPHLGRKRLRAGFLARFGIAEERTTWEWSRTVGHLGAGDQFAGFDHLVSSGTLAAGDLVVWMSVGAGFTYSCAVVEILEEPARRDAGAAA